VQRWLLPPSPGEDPRATRQSFGLGLSVFTPDDTKAVHPPADQRPYASYAYLLYGLEQDFDAGENAGKPGGTFLLSSRFFSNLEVQAGLIGPEPGHTLQDGFHRIWPAGGNANGWDARHLNYEPTLNVFYNRVWSGFPLPGLLGGGAVAAEDRARPFLSLDLAEGWTLSLQPRPHLGFALGNVYDYGSGGLELRAGLNVPDNLGPPTVRPAAPGGDYFPHRSVKAPITTVS
jgi:hypothetical protein